MIQFLNRKIEFKRMEEALHVARIARLFNEESIRTKGGGVLIELAQIS